MEIAHRANAGERLAQIRDVARHGFPGARLGRAKNGRKWIRARSICPVASIRIPTCTRWSRAASRHRDTDRACQPIRIILPLNGWPHAGGRAKTVVRIPSVPEDVVRDPVLYAHASRTLHLESNPAMPALWCRATVSATWLNAADAADTEEMDLAYGQFFARNPHLSYGDARIPAWDMIKFSINIMRGCFGCTFCSITEHEGRIIQSRSLNRSHEIESIPIHCGFTGHTDLGGPTANMYRMACKDPKNRIVVPPLSCVYPGICENMQTRPFVADQAVPQGPRRAGVKRVSIGSGRALRSGGRIAGVHQWNW